MADVVVFGENPVSRKEIVEIAQSQKQAALSTHSEWRERIHQSQQFLERQWKDHRKVYGVTTGYGNSCDVEIPAALVEELPTNLVRFHGCGMGRVLSIENARAVMAVRLASLVRG